MEENNHKVTFLVPQPLIIDILKYLFEKSLFYFDFGFLFDVHKFPMIFKLSNKRQYLSRKKQTRIKNQQVLIYSRTTLSLKLQTTFSREEKQKNRKADREFELSRCELSKGLFSIRSERPHM